MTNPDNTAAYEAIRAALAGRPLVVIDRFTSAGRTWLRDPSTGSGLSPDLAVRLYDSWPQAGQHQVLALERLTRRRDNRAKHAWLDLMAPVVSHELSSLQARDPVLHCWYSTPALKRLARAGSTILARPTDVRLVLEDKTAFPHLMRDAGLPTDLWVNSVVLGHGGVAEGFSELQRRLDADTLVVQAAHGSGGRGTVFTRTAAEFEQATIYRPVRVAAYVPGASSNLSVLTVPHPRHAEDCSVYVDAPSLKGIAVADLGIGLAKSAGNDWSKPWPADQLTRLISGIEEFARWAYRVHRLTGLWGVDVIWSPDGAVLRQAPRHPPQHRHPELPRQRRLPPRPAQRVGLAATRCDSPGRRLRSRGGVARQRRPTGHPLHTWSGTRHRRRRYLAARILPQTAPVCLPRWP